MRKLLDRSLCEQQWIKQYHCLKWIVLSTALGLQGYVETGQLGSKGAKIPQLATSNLPSRLAIVGLRNFLVAPESLWCWLVVFIYSPTLRAHLANQGDRETPGDTHWFRPEVRGRSGYSFLESTEPRIFSETEWLSETSQFLPTWSWDQAVWNRRTCEQRVRDRYWGGEVLLPFVLPRAVDAKLAWRRRERCIYVNWTVNEVIILNLTGWEEVFESDWINFLPSSQIGTWNHKIHVKLWNKLCV